MQQSVRTALPIATGERLEKSRHHGNTGIFGVVFSEIPFTLSADYASFPAAQQWH